MSVTDADTSLARRIGVRLRRLRKERQLTLAVLAQRADLSLSYLSAVENGVNLPSLPVLARLTEALNVSIPAVLVDEGCPFAVIGDVPAAVGSSSVSHPQLQLQNAVLRSVAGDVGVPPVEIEGRDLFVFLLSGALTVVIDGESFELNTGDAVDVSRPRTVSWSSPGDAVTVWTSCPEQT